MPNSEKDEGGEPLPRSDMPQSWHFLRSAIVGFLSSLYGLVLLIGGGFGLIFRIARSTLNQAGRLIGRSPRTYLDRSLSPTTNNILVPPEYKLDRVWFAGAEADECWIEVIENGVVVYRHEHRGTHKFRPPLGRSGIPLHVVHRGDCRKDGKELGHVWAFRN